MPEKRYDYVNTSDVLRHAIEDNTIPVLYQPIFDVNTKRITSLDTIVRVHDAQGCTLAPRIRKLELTTKAGHFLLEGRYYYGLSDIYKNSKKDTFSRSNNGTIIVKVTYLIDIKK